MTAHELDIAAAQQEALARVRPLATIAADLADAHGRVLAEAPCARWDLPGADVATMDGWAIRSADLVAASGPRVQLRRRGESAAGHPHGEALGQGEARRISTGAVLPPGADAVVAQEDCAVHGEHLEVDRDRVGVFGPGHFVRAAGSDVEAGSLLLPARAALGPGELALLAGCGHSVVHVHRAPRVAILCTGDELVPVGAWPQRGQVISANGLMLAWQAREAGAEVIDLGIARDDPDELRAALERGTSGVADILVTCGGISVGDHDLVLPTLIGLGASVVFRRVRLRPGRPTTMLEVPHPGGPASEPYGARIPVFALPGNPASAHVAFELFVRPVLRRMQGHMAWQRPQREVVLTHACPRDPRRAHVIRAVVAGDQATPLPDQTSGALRSIAGHNALIELAHGTGPAEAGTRATALLVGDA